MVPNRTMAPASPRGPGREAIPTGTMSCFIAMDLFPAWPGRPSEWQGRRGQWRPRRSNAWRYAVSRLHRSGPRSVSGSRRCRFRTTWHFLLVDNPEHVDQEQNEQYGAQPYARTPTVTPTAVAVVPPASAQNQQQNDQQYQHGLVALLRGSRLLILDLQFVYHLLHVGNGTRDPFSLPAFGLRGDLAGQRDHMVLDRVLHGVVQLALNEGCVQVLLDPLIQIRIHGSGIAFGAHRDHRNLVRHNLAARERFRDGFRLRLVAVGFDVSAQGHDSLVAILRDGNLLQARLIECRADVGGNVGRFHGL